MKRIVTVIVVTAGLILLPLVVPSTGLLGRVHVANAASGATLTGEVFQTSAFTITNNTTCGDPNAGFTIDFTATGTAKGPVNGTYSITNGVLNFGINSSTGSVNVVGVSGSFTITNNGSQVAYGSVTTNSLQPYPGLDPNPPTGSNPFGYCTFAQPNVDTFVDFTAMVGSTQLSAEAELTVTPVNGSGTQENFQQTFLSSTTIYCQSSIDMPFNGTAIAGNTTIWVPAVLQVKGLSSSQSATIYFSSETVNIPGMTGTAFNVPNGSVTFSPTATSVTTYTSSSGWLTTVPSSSNGKTFFAGVEIPVPSSLAGSISPVTFTGQISSNVHGLKVHWQWGAAVYTMFSTDYTQLGVVPTDGGYEAGTPQNFTQYVTGGARGGGGNYTGGWSATGSCTT
jgi:hypothetical protein